MGVTQRILVVDDDPSFARTLVILLEGEGYTVETAHSGSEALNRIEQSSRFDAMVCDLAMPGMSGLDVLRNLEGRNVHLPVIMMTAHSSIETAVEAIKLGARQYLAKPIDPEELLLQIERAVEHVKLARAHRDLRRRTGDPERFDVVIGSSPAMTALRRVVEQLAMVDSTVLIRGETGTGKELVARSIHRGGPRADGAFVVVNCTAIPGDLLESELFGHEKGAFTGATSARAGRIEQADGGTLLLDEIGDMPISLQPKLLRFLQERQVQRVGSAREKRVDVRVLAATHRNLEQALCNGDFREDLFHRLNTVPITIPPLRDRREDLPELIKHLTAKVCQRLGGIDRQLPPAFAERLESMPLTGNVRELENLIERQLVIGDSPDALDVTAAPPGDGGPPPRELAAIPLDNGFQSLREAFQRAEKDLVARAVVAWANLSDEQIARRLGTRRRVLERRMKDYGIVKPR